MKLRSRWLGALALGTLLTGTLVAAPAVAPEASALVRVCAPKKCVTVQDWQYKPVGASGGGNYRYRAYSGWCSQSIGCFTIDGRNYLAINGPRPTAAQENAIRQCAVALGVTVASAASGGTLGWTMIGVGTTLWGCASI